MLLVYVDLVANQAPLLPPKRRQTFGLPVFPARPTRFLALSDQTRPYPYQTQRFGIQDSTYLGTMPSSDMFLLIAFVLVTMVRECPGREKEPASSDGWTLPSPGNTYGCVISRPPQVRSLTPHKIEWFFRCGLNCAPGNLIGTGPVQHPAPDTTHGTAIGLPPH